MAAVEIHSLRRPKRSAFESPLPHEPHEPRLPPPKAVARVARLDLANSTTNRRFNFLNFDIPGCRNTRPVELQNYPTDGPGSPADP